jgi:hypothetical protein
MVYDLSNSFGWYRIALKLNVVKLKKKIFFFGNIISITWRKSKFTK